MTTQTNAGLSNVSEAIPREALNVLTVDGQHLNCGSTDQSLCAGDLISVALFAVSMELLGLDAVMEYVSLEPSGSKSSADVLNSENLPYNPFMWNGVLALCSLLEEKVGDAITIVAECWAKLCGMASENCSIEYDEAFEAEDKRKNFHRISFLVHKSLDLKKFPAKPPPQTVVSTFFRIRAIKTSIHHLGGIAAVFANNGIHPLTNMCVFQANTVKCVLSMMYSAGCEAQSGEMSFKVGVPAKSSSEGAILIVWPNLMGLCVISSEVQENGVSVGGSKFCFDLGNEFNCHVLAGSSISSAKQDPSLYHFHSDMELCNDLMYAAECGDIMALSKLHHLGFRLDSENYDHRSAAHLAAENGQMKALMYLYDKDIELKVKDRWGNYPLDGAIRNGHQKVVSLLNQILGEENGFLRLADRISCMKHADAAPSAFSVKNAHSVRTVCPVAAKMISENASYFMQGYGDDDGAVMLITDDKAARKIQRKFRRFKRRSTMCW
eukprot:gnl/MRDRNA2_/MRDRNA2_81454_c1_seq5.p1 gnl/MRDRNA2_/MRDRNA2_81454_c1~~gnl/MRDRNA2_/MRDRNA2_81454_c1_seq5.p1  ORF type:complete len:515 (+),score=85.46 gnl/MRDRNA2_/MRDRNA2_81454_c1_seq5:64-1545(+)